MSSILEIKNINSGYDILQVLWDLSLYIDEGELVALIGSNGAGKSTTLRTIAGLLKPDSGQILFNGKDITGVSTHLISQMGISYVSEKLNLFTAMSVEENLILGAYSIRDKDVQTQTLEYVFELFPRLDERRNQLAGTMSGGERKMLAIARGMMSKPQLMLVDEPSLGLQPSLTKNVFNALLKLRDTGVTILLVEQNVNATLSFSDRAYILEQGKIVMQGPSKEIRENKHVKNAYLGI